MLVSRGFSCVRNLQRLTKNAVQLKEIARNSHHWSYRKGAPPASKNIMMCAEVVQGIAWWWVLWHLWTEPDHILGEFEYPDPRKWTDQELGIPSE
ncbi:unnamed protein product [Acanthoscelides obtectus]|uniref:NADH dehydrogenase [ubiquinone] 1 beta subcomplex subunit 2, mitochondrial n=1 Tax=Acanthoscelides obtectus TaxID=200917 RepID=A0A9P0LB20_ACAOB|nr:unnamed protein product [Acanthoscelides obtectus]CAK1640565.1 NADH dehydrogenase [ubiquinone] 1 beta subcomplex subunit 2, mitochondrial [Acanthoscelides obtectus]